MCGKIMTAAGRTTYAKSVITSQAIHHLTYLVLQKVTMECFKKIERGLEPYLSPNRAWWPRHVELRKIRESSLPQVAMVIMER